MPRSNCRQSSPAPTTEPMSARSPIALKVTPPALLAPAAIPARAAGRAYRVRSLAAKIALIPAVVVMLGCYYASVTWTVYISMTRSFLLPVYKFAGAAQYDRLFATTRWQAAYGNMFLF